MQSPIGSVFLGDVQRIRLLSTPPSSTPPSSPPPHLASSAMNSIHDLDLDVVEQPKPLPKPPSIPPVLSLDLRLRWLETLLYGARTDTASDRKHTDLKAAGSLARRAEELQHKLDAVVHGNDGLRKFMDHYDQHAQYLTPAFALSGALPSAEPTYDNMSPGELEAFLTEMESDIRAAERDMREIKSLEDRDVLGAGKLADYEGLQPRLDLLLKAHKEDAELAVALERRIATLMDQYATRVDTLSELFVAWDDTLRDSEDKVGKAERDRDERRRLGYE
ncbi:uncharacterized protein FIBRA_02786 [Fibroporia radiculosa]|uniref:Uncharacterized protein n=1 Tax=Fibroporia radiculosa TaxID=599839 RepID=J4I990_9APHY|nr:uncharacterized protein FIBRA_02786 [Fibroporia radiculosa]CCM00746.1 predicted protein [Fibroporia radiculosa]